MVLVCGTLSLLLVLLIPYMLLQHRGINSLFRLSAAYFALLPTMSLAMMVHLFDGHELLVMEFNWENGLNQLANFLQVVVPALLILCFMYQKEDFVLKRWHVIFMIIQAVGVVGMIFLPELSSFLMHSVFYMLVILAYDWWEQLLEKNTQLSVKVMSWLIFGMFYGRGCYRMLELMSQFKL